MAEYTDENSLHASECLRRLLGAERDEIRLAVEARATTVELKSGGVLFEQDDSAESMYIVVRGRLRVTVRRPDGSEHVVNEITRDQSVGEIAMFTTEPRSASVVAIRDSMLLRLMRVDFERIATLFPAFSLEVSRQVIERFSRAIRGGPARIGGRRSRSRPGPQMLRECRVVAIHRGDRRRRPRAGSGRSCGAAERRADSGRSDHAREVREV